MNEAILVECAQWLYARNQENLAQGKTLYWTPFVLTDRNTDKSNPRVSIDDAYEVFLELVKRRLAVHATAIENGIGFAAFEILKGKEDDWKKLVGKKGFWELTGLPTLKWLFSKIWLVILFVLGTVVTIWLTKITESKLNENESPTIYNIRLEADQLKQMSGFQQEQEVPKPPLSSTP